MKTAGKHIFLAAGLALALPFGLTACSDDSESGKASRQDVYDGWSGMMEEDLAEEGMTQKLLNRRASRGRTWNDSTTVLSTASTMTCQLSPFRSLPIRPVPPLSRPMTTTSLMTQSIGA